jgi:hypothetical protein
MKKRWILAGTAVVLAIVSISWVILIGSRQPSNDRNWAEGFSRVTTVDSSADGSLFFHDVRDSSYTGTTTETDAWHDVHVNPADITGATFFIDFFSPIKLVAHTFISFQMKDGTSLALSIEARREKGEDYSFIGGFLRDYELQYIWGTERDFISERVVYREQPVHLYPLTISAPEAQAILKSFAEETNTLAATPRFYNTLFANCTNLLAKTINAHYPHTLPYDISWNLTGLSDTYLMHHGYITIRTSPEVTRTAAALLPYRATIESLSASSSAQFSSATRTLIGD